MISSLRLLGMTLLALVASSSSVEAATHFTQPQGSHQHWVKAARAPAETPVKMVIAVKQKNTELLREIFDSVSNPQSPLYGNYMSLDQVHELTGQPDAADAVMKYVASQVEPLFMEATQGGDYIKIALRAGDAEKLLNTKYHTYVAKDNKNKTIVRAQQYTVPDAMEKNVDFVGYVNHFPNRLAPMRSPLVSKKNVKDASGNTVLSTLNQAYSIDSNTVTNAKSTNGVFEDGQNFDPNDLSSFEQQYGIPSQAVATVIGTNDPTQCASNPDACGEASLDVQYLIAVAQGGPMTYYASNPNDQQPFLDWLIALDQDASAPWVNSVSYGEPETQVPAATTSRFEQEMQKLGVRGITVLVSSGDDGVAGPNVRQDISQCGFAPSYPASSPFVTAVGATQGPEAGSAEVGESSATGGLITTGGGFSTVWAAPSWQSSFVSAFLASNATGAVPPTSLYASTGRGYPDVALDGHNYVVTIAGQQEIVSGTSASAPVFAGLITLINSARFDLGKKPLGFLNPVLYQLAQTNPDVFQDVTQGTNNCAAAQSNPNCCQYGFTATKGWDAVTGLGSVNFTKLKAALVALP